MITVAAYSSKEVQKLGKRLRDGSSDAADLEMLNEFIRFYDPLLLEVALQTNGLVSHSGVPNVLSGRSKRTKSIIRKLRRPESRGMDLSRMADIAGLRIVVRDVAAQDAILAILAGGFPVKSVHDYRDAGRLYRAVHVVVNQDGRFVEIQVRTCPQHMWADESEYFGEQAKEGRGDDSTKEYLRDLATGCAELDAGRPVHESRFLPSSEAPSLLTRRPPSLMAVRQPFSVRLPRLIERFDTIPRTSDPVAVGSSYVVVFDTHTGERLHEYAFSPSDREGAMDTYQDLAKKLAPDHFDVLILNSACADALPVTHPRFFD